MQINGLSSYTAQQLSPSQRTHHMTIAMPNTNDLQDSFSISELGKRISMRRTDKANRLTGGNSQVQEVAELMSESLAKVESTLEKMQELVEKASGEDLTSLDRINMQIEYEELRETLSGASLKMNEELARISHQKVDKPLLTETVSAPDGTKILERARDRLMRGEDWDVAEAYQRAIDEETGEEVKGSWMTGDLVYMIDGTKVSTVRDKIEGSGTVNLMSSVTAKEGLKGIDAQLTRVQDMRETFSSFIMNYNGDDLDGGMKVKDLPESERLNKFDSVLGIVEYQGAVNGPQFAHSEPKLITPTNGLGSMFARIDNMFGDIAGKLAGAAISEDVVEAGAVRHARDFAMLYEDYSIQIPTSEEITSMLQKADMLKAMNRL